MRQKLILRPRQSTRLQLKTRTILIVASSVITAIAFAVFSIYGNFGAGDKAKAAPVKEGSTTSVKLIQFTGITKNGKIVLSWATVAEVNNDYFTVEKSNDGTCFEEYGTIEGAGNSTVLKQYSLDDLHPNNGKNYYRLKQTDRNGDFEYCRVIAVESEAIKEAIEIIALKPNPFTNNFSIEFKVEDDGECDIMILDAKAGIVSKEKVNAFAGNNNFSSAHAAKLAAGIYYVKIFKKASSSPSVKSIKQSSGDI